ncbi:MAG: hypothetical protein ACTSRI_09990 [Promethearchaeota archaeon]
MLEIDESGLIYFKKRPSDIQWDEKMNKKGMVDMLLTLNDFAMSISIKLTN